MRLLSSRLRILLVLALTCALSLTVALALPGTARAGNGNGKVGPRLAAEVAASDPNADLRVIVLGTNPAAAVGKHNGKVSGSVDLIGGVAATIKAKDVAGVADDSDTSFLSADVPLLPTDTLDPSKLATLYPPLDGAPAAWGQGLDGSGVGVALIDSGVRKLGDFNNTLVQVRVPGIDVDPDDTYGHGTLVAGVLSGLGGSSRYVGIAPRAKVYSINVNTPTGVHSSDVINALGWVFQNAHTYNIRVVNLSLQETLPSTYQMSLLDLAVERLWAAGVVVVAAAGNGGLGAVDFAPANDPLALSVGASDNHDTLGTGDDTLASFSASGTTVDGFVKPELVAPGRHIVSTLPKDTTLGVQAPLANWAASGYASISGTSFSAPQAAAAAAILFQQHPGWSPDMVKWALASLTSPLSGSNAGSLSLSAAIAYSGQVGLANQGVPALVCSPGSSCIVGGAVGTVSSTWNSSTWNSSTWNSSTWNSSTWNSSTWNSSTWNSSTWNSSTWNSSTWNSSTWNSSTWNSSTWNSSTWNSSTWNGFGWE